MNIGTAIIVKEFKEVNAVWARYESGSFAMKKPIRDAMPMEIATGIPSTRHTINSMPKSIITCISYTS